VDDAGLSAGCADCYGADVSCLIANCIADCATDPTSQACSDCRDTNCGAALDECTGVICPEPA
jgi:hypothetical protein